MDWNKYFKTVEAVYPSNDMFEVCKAIYRELGYDHEQDFPGEYYFMYNTVSGEKVRLYYNGRVIEI